MSGPAGAPAFDYARYLAAKTTVEDRALNSGVLAALRPLLPSAPRVLEVGAGLGTMAARLTDWGVLAGGEYTLLDADEQLLAAARTWLRGWASARGLACELLPDGLSAGDLRVRLVHAPLERYAQDGAGPRADLLVASAVLDLVDVPAVLPGLLALARPGGAYWLGVNYDGESIFVPGHPLDDRVLAAYHRDMDERVRDGARAGDSRTGRALFAHLRAAGAPPLAAGSSDWVVHPGPGGGYPADEEYFTGAILTTIEGALARRPDWVAPGELACWLAARRAQLAAGELVYVAHQLDFAGRAPG